MTTQEARRLCMHHSGCARLSSAQHNSKFLFYLGRDGVVGRRRRLAIDCGERPGCLNCGLLASFLRRVLYHGLAATASGSLGMTRLQVWSGVRASFGFGFR